MPQIVFATCRTMPDFQPDDLPIAKALEARGASVTPVPWNGPFEPFQTADMVVVRSTWDYFDHADEFASWLIRLEAVPGKVHNSPNLMAWNAQKTYLLDLADQGAPLPPTRLTKPTAVALSAAMHELELEVAVAKPVVGAGASGLTILRRDDPASFTQAATKLAKDAIGCDALVQPLLEEIRLLGETSFTFFGSEFSHAVVKRPSQDSILVQAEHGGTTSPIAPNPQDLQLARQMLTLLPEPATFARVDMVLTKNHPLLMEVEVIEPELFVLHDQEAPNRLATLLLP